MVNFKSKAFPFYFRVTLILCLFFHSAEAQILSGAGQIHGSMEVDAATYNRDTAIGAPTVPEKLDAQNFTELDYTNGRISAGVRFETYDNALQGYDPRYNGSGLAYRYARYSDSLIDVTVGNFYEQFGSGMILRTYWSYPLGVDNSLDGVRLRITPHKGIYIKAVAGHQRYYWTEGLGIVRGVDGEINMNELIPGWEQHKTNVILGGSFVSKYQTPDNPSYNMPGNVGASAGRINITNGGFSFYTEYTYKINDPSAVNGYLFNPGQGLYSKMTYAQKGLSFSLAAERIQNMSFKSDNAAVKNDLDINYLPFLPRTETYQVATFFPYATQPNGEEGADAETLFNLPRGSFLGGHYGTNVDIEFSAINSLDTTTLNDLNTTRQGYSSKFFGMGQTNYWDYLTVELQHKFSPKFRMIAQYDYETYNTDIIQQEVGLPVIHANMGVLDGYWRVTDNNTLHIEAQEFYCTQYQGSWAVGLAEFNFGPDWFIGALDEYNYGNPVPWERIHYATFTAGYTKGFFRITLGYGKTRAGILCIGGVCRQIPAADGFSLSLTQSF